jgi:hypothetical protein
LDDNCSVLETPTISKALKRYYLSDIGKLVVAAERQQMSSGDFRDGNTQSLDQQLPHLSRGELKILEVRFLAELAECHERLAEEAFLSEVMIRRGQTSTALEGPYRPLRSN